MMKRKLGLAVITSFVVLGLTACSTFSHARHEYIMRGQVISAEGNNVYLCVGNRDGAQVGQELAVNRVSSRPGSPKASMPIFTRTLVGRVRIGEIVDEHFAKALVLTGDVQTNDVVELENP